MRIKTKGRYGLAVLVYLASQPNRIESLSSIAQTLQLSKLYLEQVLSILKTQHWVTSIKGPSGGYAYSGPKELSVYEVFRHLENDFMPVSPTPSTPLEVHLQNEVYDVLDRQMKQVLQEMTIDQLVHAQAQEMYFI